MKFCNVVSASFAFCALTAAANATVLNSLLEVTGTTVPTNPEILPGFSGYTVHLKALQSGDIVGAIDVGLNAVDFPNTSSTNNYGLFGPMHQHWHVSDGDTISTPTPNNDLTDSHFLFTYNVAVMTPRENNNVSPGGIVSPLTSDASNDWGVGSEMRAIVGVAQLHAADLPFVYLVIPDGQSVQFVGLVSTQTGATAPLIAGTVSPADASSVVSFSVGTPEPASMTVAFGTLLFCSRRSRKA